MIEKLKNDELIFHKAGLIIGALAGVVIGFIVSDRADQYQVEEVSDYGKDAAGNWPRVKIEKGDLNGPENT